MDLIILRGDHNFNSFVHNDVKMTYALTTGVGSFLELAFSRNRHFLGHDILLFVLVKSVYTFLKQNVSKNFLMIEMGGEEDLDFMGDIPHR